jgi:hypothetical protein
VVASWGEQLAKGSCGFIRGNLPLINIAEPGFTTLRTQYPGIAGYDIVAGVLPPGLLQSFLSVIAAITSCQFMALPAIGDTVSSASDLRS